MNSWQPSATAAPRASEYHGTIAAGPHFAAADSALAEDSASLLPPPDAAALDDDAPARASNAAPTSDSTPASAAAPAPPGYFAVRNLKKSYRKGPIAVPVLHSISLDVHQGEFLAIMGHSGSGKSTLLHLMGTLDDADSGEIHLAGRRIDRLPRRDRDALRNRTFGMIFQFYHLLPELTALENVVMPLLIHHSIFGYWKHRKAAHAKAKELLEMVGLGHRLHHKPRELSGGEMQRAAIARALIHEPQVLLADEPTGNLDRATGNEILRLLRGLNRQQKLTIVMVTHDSAIARQADRLVRLGEGRLETI